VVVYKIDRLTRSLADFAKIVEILDARGASFVSVTQQFNTTTSIRLLTLNVLLSFAQFEREVIGERIRDKIAASKKKGMWMGGVPPLGYRVEGRNLVIVDGDAEVVRSIFRCYTKLGSVRLLKDELETLQRCQGIRDPTVVPHLAPQATFRDRHDDPVLVNIKPDIRDTIPQEESPMQEARHRPIRRNPRYLHTVRRVAPSSGGHMV
jgi:hypothetical protein